MSEQRLPPNMGSEWFYQLMGETVGPVSQSGLKELAWQGKITLDTPVRQGTDGQWVPAHGIKWLFSTVGFVESVPPPGPSEEMCSTDELNLPNFPTDAIEEPREILPSMIPPVPRSGPTREGLYGGIGKTACIMLALFGLLLLSGTIYQLSREQSDDAEEAHTAKIAEPTDHGLDEETESIQTPPLSEPIMAGASGDESILEIDKETAGPINMDSGSYSARVVEVCDGDILAISVEGKGNTNVCLAGIDAPELNQPFGIESRKALQQKLLGAVINVKAMGRDEDNRILAIVYLGDQCVNIQMVQEGLAWHFKQSSDSPTLAAAEANARKQKLGLWGASIEPQAPWDWLKTQQERLSAAEKTSPSVSRNVIGSWTAKGTPYATIANGFTIFLQGGQLFIEEIFKDGSIGTRPLAERPSPHGRRFEDRYTASTGDYFLLDSQGNLQLRDKHGLFCTLKRIR